MNLVYILGVLFLALPSYAQTPESCGKICGEAKEDFGGFELSFLPEVFRSESVTGMRITPIDENNFTQILHGSWRTVVQNVRDQRTDRILESGDYMGDNSVNNRENLANLEFEKYDSGLYEQKMLELGKKYKKVLKHMEVQGFTVKSDDKIYANSISLVDPHSIGIDVKAVFPFYSTENFAESLALVKGALQLSFSPYNINSNILAFGPESKLADRDESRYAILTCKHFSSTLTSRRYLLCEEKSASWNKTSEIAPDLEYRSDYFTGSRVIGYFLFVYKFGVTTKMYFDPSQLNH